MTFLIIKSEKPIFGISWLLFFKYSIFSVIYEYVCKICQLKVQNQVKIIFENVNLGFSTSELAILTLFRSELNHNGLKFVEFEDFKLISCRILANLGTRSLNLAEFAMVSA